MHVHDKITTAPIDCKLAEYPALHQFAIPLINTSIH